MPFASSTRECVLYVSWRGFAAADLPRVIEQIATLRRATGGPVVYLSRIPSDNRVFTEEERDGLLVFLRMILPSCSTIHHVVEGDGFVRSARTSIVTSMAFSTSRPRDFYTHATLSEAAAWISDEHHVDLGDLVKAPSAKRSSSSPAKRSSSKPPRASSAFRAAVRLATRTREPGERPAEPKKRKP